jgi:hypothetical protein
MWFLPQLTDIQKKYVDSVSISVYPELICKKTSECRLSEL